MKSKIANAPATLPPIRSDRPAHPVTPNEQLRLLCVDIAREAGDFAHRSRLVLGPGARAAHDTKSSAVDPVTEFDRATETRVFERLRAERPDDSIVGEEGSNHRGTSDLTWHIDPIDGTVNFVYDLPLWSTSVGVLRHGDPVAGAIYVPVVGDMYSAASGAGAFVNDAPISASTVADTATSLVATGFSYHVGGERQLQADRIARMLPAVRDIRRSGSAAVDLAAVAAGRVDAYFEPHINSWDVAAGVVLVREAGGVVTAFDGSALDVTAPKGLVAAGPGLHRAVVQLVSD